MKETGIHLEWHFNKEKYSKFDWTREPCESLEELYKQRAQQIRDSYDYIVVWYSGGADSWCVLDSFIKNDIKVDEIAHFSSYEADGDKHSVLNEEIFYTAIPKTQEILEKCPHTKQRLVDISQIINEMYLRPDVKYDFMYNIKGIASANSLARSYIREYVGDYKKIIDSGKKLCFIWGSEKPRLKLVNGKWEHWFIDVFSETNLRLQSMADDGYFDEWFFWAPDTAPIVAKQSHILLNMLRSATKDSPYFLDQGWAHSPQNRYGKYLSNDMYHKLIYPGWDTTTLVAPKPKNLILSERDNWFWNQGAEKNIAVRNGAAGIKELLSRVGNYWLNNTVDLTKGIKGCINTYPLE